jgi:hypothetical protein
MRFSIHEIETLLEALKLGAARKEAMARYRPSTAIQHDDEARDMRALQRRLLRLKTDLIHARLPMEG